MRLCLSLAESPRLCNDMNIALLFLDDVLSRRLYAYAYTPGKNVPKKQVRRYYIAYMLS